MLAIQYLNLRWTKECRNPEGAVARRRLCVPAAVDPSLLVDLGTSEVFVQRRMCQQVPDEIRLTAERVELLASPGDLDIPGVRVRRSDDGFEVIWFSLDGGYQPERKGVHRYRIHNRPYDREDLRCDTAFYLAPGESGVLRYNYRFANLHGQHYEQFCVYVVDTDRLSCDTFTRASYEKAYDETVVLF